MTFVDLLVATRTKREMSQKDFAEALGFKRKKGPRAMLWKQDDIGHFANHPAGPSAQVVRDRLRRRWSWHVFHANGAKLWKANSRTLDEAKSNAEVMMCRAVER